MAIHPMMILVGFGGIAAVAGVWMLGQAIACRRFSLGTLTGASLGIAVFAIGVAALGVAAGLRAYQVFTRETLIARVRCETAGEPQQFLLHYQPVEGAPQAYLLHGDQWIIDGEILKWHPRLMFLGFQTVQKPTRIGGRYASVRDQTSHYPTAHDLNGGVDLTWRFLYAVGRYWPGVEAIYGSSAYLAAEPEVTYGVYATATGYLVKPLTGQR